MQSLHQVKTIINVTGRSPTLLSVCRTALRKGEHRGVLNGDHTTEYRCGHVGKHGLGETGGQCEVHAGGKKGMINAGQRAASTATHRSGGARELVPREQRSGILHDSDTQERLQSSVLSHIPNGLPHPKVTKNIFSTSKGYIKR
jgi:hypothetical protein